jgi:hypothetical protein
MQSQAFYPAESIQSTATQRSSIATAWARGLPEKLTATHFAKNYRVCIEPESSLSCSQDPVTDSYSQPAEYSSQLYVYDQSD